MTMLRTRLIGFAIVSLIVFTLGCGANLAGEVEPMANTVLREVEARPQVDAVVLPLVDSPMARINIQATTAEVVTVTRIITIPSDVAVTKIITVVNNGQVTFETPQVFQDICLAKNKFSGEIIDTAACDCTDAKLAVDEIEREASVALDLSADDIAAGMCKAGIAYLSSAVTAGKWTLSEANLLLAFRPTVMPLDGWLFEDTLSFLATGLVVDAAALVEYRDGKTTEALDATVMEAGLPQPVADYVTLGYQTQNTIDTNAAWQYTVGTAGVAQLAQGVSIAEIIVAEDRNALTTYNDVLGAITDDFDRAVAAGRFDFIEDETILEIYRDDVLPYCFSQSIGVNPQIVRPALLSTIQDNISNPDIPLGLSGIGVDGCPKFDGDRLPISPEPPGPQEGRGQGSGSPTFEVAGAGQQIGAAGVMGTDVSACQSELTTFVVLKGFVFSVTFLTDTWQPLKEVNGLSSGDAFTFCGVFSYMRVVAAGATTHSYNSTLILTKIEKK